MNKKSAKLGEILLLKHLINQEQLNEALWSQEVTGEKLGEILIKKGFVLEAEVMNALSIQTGIELINLDNYPVNNEATLMISEKLAVKTNSFPIDVLGDKLLVATDDPLNIFNVEDIELESGMKVDVVFASKTQVKNAIDKYMSSRNTELAAKEIDSKNILNEMSVTAVAEDDYVNNSPIVRLINSVIKQAIVMNASDIHIEPFEQRVRIRMRIDGDLHEILTVSINSLSAIVTRLKVMSSMNIAEKRLPQDGRIEMEVDNSTIDMRVSILPTIYGEKVVIRLLNRDVFLKDKRDLGFTEENLRLFETIIQAPNGIVLITGPTGSGKSTTLYSYLNELNKTTKNIITVEDPVEYKIDGINQVQVNNKIGLTFANNLRTMLRQDPDIIMIGEIRDTETAEIAVRAAITGHLVISTLHTNDAPSTVVRLKDMGIEPFLIAASLKGVIAQRLVKRICTNCKGEYIASKYEKNLLEIKNDKLLYKGIGCPKCYNTGYSGRIAIHEIMRIDKEVRDVIYIRGSVDELNNVLINKGMTTLKDNCRRLVMDGVTTIDEYSQIVFKL